MNTKKEAKRGTDINESKNINPFKKLKEIKDEII